MKKILLSIIVIIASLSVSAQISYEKGYLINNENQRIECLIENMDWKDNPSEFNYKLSENSPVEKGILSSIKEFGVDNFVKYVRTRVNIDTSSIKTGEIDYNKLPSFAEKELFLKILVQGKASLYEYSIAKRNIYFYQTDNSAVKQLVYKRYKNSNSNEINENNTYRQDLFLNLTCADIKQYQFENLAYNSKVLVKLFVTYNKCTNADYISYNEKNEKNTFNLNLKLHISHSNLNISHIPSNFYDKDFNNKLTPGLGFEGEFILPINDNKWSAFIEPTFQYLNIKNTRSDNNISGGELKTAVNYSYLKIPIGLRYRFANNLHSSFFVDVAYTLNINMHSKLNFTRNNGSYLYTLDILAKNNITGGIGYKFKDYSISLRYNTAQKVISYPDWKATYKSMSLIFGHSIF